jgi:hypothetical protein
MDQSKAKELTARHILFHQSGLPIKQPDALLKFQFTPGTAYGYLNPGIVYLGTYSNLLRA